MFGVYLNLDLSGVNVHHEEWLGATMTTVPGKAAREFASL